MSAIDLILDALLAEITPGIQQDLSEEIWDAYDHLESVLMERLSGRPDAQDMINRYREFPDIYSDVLAEALVAANVENDGELLDAAAEVQALVTPPRSDRDDDDVMNVPGTAGDEDADTDYV